FRRLQERRLPGAVLAQIQLRSQGHRRLSMSVHPRIRPVASIAVAAAMAAALTLSVGAQSDVQSAVNAAFTKYKALQEGKNADYIPALAKVDPKLFGIAIVGPDGKLVTAGDVKTEVSIQSISKVFTMARVIQDQGPDAIEKTIGVD